MNHNATHEEHASSQRADWMRELAQASHDDLNSISAVVEHWPDYQILENPAVGTLMIHGRIAGNGSAFPVGECSVTHCVVQDAQGYTGYAWILGQQPGIALWAARWDALLQDPVQFPFLWNQGIEKLRKHRIHREAVAAEKMQHTQVQFFSMENMRA